MMKLPEISVIPGSLDRFVTMLGRRAVEEVRARAERVRRRLRGHTVWTINSTAAGGGVAEMLRFLVSYARDLEIDIHWLVVPGTPEFFRVTKRLHNALHGWQGDDSPLGQPERAIYESVTDANARALRPGVRPGDVAILHDPQTAGLIPSLAQAGVHVIWRCHVGGDPARAEARKGWNFLSPYLSAARIFVFSSETYRPEECRPEQSRVVHPCIDPFSAKNQNLEEEAVRAILVRAGLVQGSNGQNAATFLRQDDSKGTVRRRARMVEMDGPPAWDAPLVVQVSRWDHLKDPIGVLRGFTRTLESSRCGGAELILAGPEVTGVVDDPEGAQVLRETEQAWRDLPAAHRRRTHLACLPMADLEENAAIVNALQRHATVVVQKSLQEGFGLTVTEAMWKMRPVLASAVGGIPSQIQDGVHGLLIDHPEDLSTFSSVLGHLLADVDLGARLARRARERVVQEFLGPRSLAQYADIIDSLL
ncbi:MAG: glycosyltransferase [Acidobacteriota bacterium]